MRAIGHEDHRMGFTIIPGILQTPDYARDILSNSDLNPAQADTHLVTRLDRQRILSRPEPVRYQAIINERALHEPIASEDIMSDQVDHLLEVARRPNVSLRVLTAESSYHPGMLGSFFLYVRDSKSPAAGQLTVSRQAWSAVLRRLR